MMDPSNPTWRGEVSLFRFNPITLGIIGLWIVAFLSAIIGFPLGQLLAFDPARPLQAVVGAFTYPLAVGIDPLGLLINGYVFYWAGGSLERGWRGHQGRFLLFLLLTNLAALIVWELGLLLVTRSIQPLAGPWFMISSAIVAWAWFNPGQTIYLLFLIPFPTRYLPLLTMGLLFFIMPLATVPPSPWVLALGPFTLGGVGVAYLFVHGLGVLSRYSRRRSPSRPPLRHPSSGPFGFLLRPFREWQRRRRAAHLKRTIKFDEFDD